MQPASSVGALNSQQGVALLVVLMLTMILAVIGIASLTLTGLENRMASFIRAGEAASSASEACMNTAVKVIQRSIENAGTVPADFLSNVTPAGPVPNTNKATLDNELRGVTGYENYNDDVSAAPNVYVPNPASTLNNFVVQGDIDRLHTKYAAGAGAVMIAGYEGLGGGAAGGGVEIIYRVNCLATNAATNARARVTAVYLCKQAPDGCYRKI